MIKLILADDHPVFVSGLRAVFDSEEDLAVMAVATTGRKAVDAATEHQPDVAVLDLNMPDGDGLWPAPGGGVGHACAHPHHVRRRRERTRRAPSRGIRLHAQGVRA